MHHHLVIGPLFIFTYIFHIHDCTQFIHAVTFTHILINWFISVSPLVIPLFTLTTLTWLTRICTRANHNASFIKFHSESIKAPGPSQRKYTCNWLKRQIWRITTMIALTENGIWEHPKASSPGLFNAVRMVVHKHLKLLIGTRSSTERATVSVTHHKGYATYRVNMVHR